MKENIQTESMSDFIIKEYLADINEHNQRFYLEWIKIIGLSSFFSIEEELPFRIRIMKSRQILQANDFYLQSNINKLNYKVFDMDVLDYKEIHKLLISIFLEPINNYLVNLFLNNYSLENKCNFQNELKKNRNIRFLNMIRKLGV